MSDGKKTMKKTATVDDEVDELLKAAEDDVFLKLNINSHMSRVAPSYLHTDLDHRFQALKKPSSSKPNKPTPNPKSTQSITTSAQKDATCVSQEGDGDDLFARFAALKGSIPSSSSFIPENRSDHGGENVDDMDEVEKIIQWAIDAARLDPSPPTDDEAELNDSDDDDDEHTDEEDESDDDDDRLKKTHKKSNRK